MGVVDTVQHRIAQVEIAGSGVDLGAQRHGAVGEFTVFHALEEVQTLLDGAVAIGALGRGVDIAAHFAHLLGRQFTDIGQALADQAHGALIHLLKIVRRIIKPVVPGEAQPADILLDGVHILRVFLAGVRVVHAQIAHASEFFRRAEVDAQRLAVADMQVSVGLRRETGVYRHPFVLPAGGDVLLDQGMNEVPGFRRFFSAAFFVSSAICSLL